MLEIPDSKSPIEPIFQVPATLELAELLLWFDSFLFGSDLKARLSASYSKAHFAADRSTDRTMASKKLPNGKFKAAAVHSAPVYMDKTATTTKVLRWIEQAANESVSLLVFPEAFIPGFPVR